MASKKCVDCDYFALEPGKRCSGACLHTYLRDVEFEKTSVVTGKMEEQQGAYGKTITWSTCPYWIPKGSIELEEPLVIITHRGFDD